MYYIHIYIAEMIKIVFTQPEKIAFRLSLPLPNHIPATYCTPFPYPYNVPKRHVNR